MATNPPIQPDIAKRIGRFGSPAKHKKTWVGQV
jgi:hypothetical protein